LKNEVRATVKLATPLAAARIGFVLLGMVDTAVVGRLGETELGAVGLGNSLFFVIVMFGGGIVIGVEPLMTQAIGAGEHGLAREAMWHGVWLGLLMSVPMLLLGWALVKILPAAGIDAQTAHHATMYVYSRLPSVPVFMVLASCRSYLQATELTRPLVVAAIAANALNLPLNWLLVFGQPALGVPQLGVVGAGLTSSAVFFLQLVVVALALRRVPCAEPFRRKAQRAPIWKSFVVGVPIGLQRLAEIGIFSITGVLMAKISTRAVASHQIAMTLATATFMVPLGISAAAAARVGHAVGAGDKQRARRAGYAAFIVAVLFTSVAALGMLLFPEALARLLTDQRPVIEAAIPLIIIAAFFQMSDGLQVVVNGALRGMGDTRAVLYVNLIGHYVIGVPLGIALAFVFDWGASGLWWGLFTGLSIVAIALLIRFTRIARRGVSRL
jgi:MATE family multidrug resistance protein